MIIEEMRTKNSTLLLLFNATYFFVKVSGKLCYNSGAVKCQVILIHHLMREIIPDYHVIITEKFHDHCQTLREPLRIRNTVTSRP